MTYPAEGVRAWQAVVAGRRWSGCTTALATLLVRQRMTARWPSCANAGSCPRGNRGCATTVWRDARGRARYSAAGGGKSDVGSGARLAHAPATTSIRSAIVP